MSGKLRDSKQNQHCKKQFDEARLQKALFGGGGIGRPSRPV